MSVVILERRFDPPLTLAELAAMKDQAGWCLEQHRVEHRTSLLARDGRLSLCAFEAPDAEAVRSVVRQVGGPVGRAWAATVYASPDHPPRAPLVGPEGTLVVVDRSFPEPVSFVALQEREDRGAWCLAQHRVRFLRTFLATDSKRMICVYRAPDAESVRLAQREAGMPFEAVWPVEAFESET